MSEDRLRRWRLVLGGADDGTGQGLAGNDVRIDAALAALYDAGSGGGGTGGPRSAGLGGSAPNVARWLGDIRTYFPSTVVQVLQSDAIERLNLSRLLLEPEMLQAVEPDIHLVGTLLSLNRVMPEATRHTARMVVAKVVEVLAVQINPQIAAHGGFAELVAVDGSIAYLRMGGGCQGCGMAAVTLSQGIEVAILDSVPEITEVVDVTDHAGGTNPYYQAAKK